MSEFVSSAASSLESSHAITGAADADAAPALSRRAFTELAIGAFAALPAVAGGFALAFKPETAHGASASEATAKVVIAKVNETGIAVADITDGKRLPVAGATVTVKSNENKKTVQGTTDKSGVLMVDLSKLTKPKKNKNGVDIYAAEVAVSMEKEGYRLFETGWLSLRGGSGYEIPTRKIGNELAYPSRVTFSDWDILYSNNEFACTPANDETHEIVITMRAKEACTIRVQLYNVNSNKYLLESNVKTSYDEKTKTHVGRVSFKGAFLMYKHSDALPVGVKYGLWYGIGDVGYSTPLQMRIVETPTGMMAPFTKKMSFGPFGDESMKLMLRFPSWVPLVAGKELVLWKPDLPVDVCFDPYGYFRAAVKTPEWGYKSKNGKVDGNSWKKLPRKPFADQFSATFDESVGNLLADAMDGKKSTFRALPKSTSFKVAVSADASIALRWTKEWNSLRGKGEARAILSIVYSYAQQFMAGPVPLLLQFDFNMHASIGVGCGVSMPSFVNEKDLKSAFKFDYPSTGLNFTLRIAPALSVGVGVKGIASISLQGMVAFTVFVGVGPLPEGGKETNPHAIVGVKFVANVVVQLLLFTISVEIWSHNIPKLYDNWDPSKLYAQSALDMQTQAAKATFDWFAENAPKAATLGEGLVEFEGAGVQDAVELQALGPQSADASAADPVFEPKVVERTTEDGMTYRILSFEAPDAGMAGDAGIAVGPGTGSLVAGSSPALAAQAEGTALQTQDSTSNVADYKAIAGAHAYVTGPISVADAKVKVGGERGLAVTTRHRLAKEVMSDPRTKVVTLYGQPTIFRIAAVKVNGKIRTRIVGEMLASATEPARNLGVFEFDPKIPTGTSGGKTTYLDRNDLWDYDFDVCLETVRTYGRREYYYHTMRIHMAVISGRRADGDAFGQTATDLTISYAQYDCYFTSPNMQYHPDKRTFVLGKVKECKGLMASELQFSKDDKFRYHNLSCPSIQQTVDEMWADRYSGRVMRVVSITFLDRAAVAPDKILSASSDDVRVSVGQMYGNEYNNQTVGIQKRGIIALDLGAMTAKHQDAEVFELAASKRLKGTDKATGWDYVTMRSGNTAYHYRYKTALADEKNPLRKMELWSSSSTDEFLDEKENNSFRTLVEWPNNPGKFLASVDGKLCCVQFTGLEGDNPKPTYTEVGPKSFPVSSFVVDPTGTLLFYPSVREGSLGHTYESKDSIHDVKGADGVEVNEHRIMACRWRDGKFCDPFVFAEVDYDLDDLCIANASKSGICFMSTDVIDADEAKADLYLTTVPFVKCANVIACSAVSPFAFPGTEALFDLTVRNDGNTFITGFTAQLSEKGGKVKSTKELKFSADTLRESVYNPSEGGKLQDVLPDYALAPGKTSVYRVAISIPKGWSGTKNVSVKAVDVVVAPLKAATTPAKASDFVARSAATRGVSTQAEGDGEETTYVYDGDFHAAYEVDDSDAVEYVVGTNEGDFDDDYDGDDTQPFDVLRIEGRNSFFDEDDFDDRDDDDDDYDLQLGGGGLKQVAGPAPRPTPKPPVQGTPVQGTPVPKTSDSLGPFPGLLGAAAVAGAAMTAYSARRVANERAAAGADDGALPPLGEA